MASLTNTTRLVYAKIVEIFQLLEEGEQKLENQQCQQNTVLVLGDTGSDKSVFIKWITNNDASLVSQKDLTYSNVHFINDTTENQFPSSFDTIFPKLVTNSTAGTSFYELPDTIIAKGMINDIATVYFIKKAVQCVENIKIIFLINYSSLTNDGSWRDLKNLIVNAMPVVKNFEKLNDSVMLLVSKVNLDKNAFSFEKIISSLVISLKNVRASLEKEMSNEDGDKSRCMRFLDTILHQNGDTYPHIQLFRLPDEAGSLDKITLMRDNKRDVTAALEKLNYTSKIDVDFGYFIPQSSLADVDILLGQMHYYILFIIKTIGQQIQKELYDKESHIHNIMQLYNVTTSTYHKLIDVMMIANQLKEPEKCVQEIIKLATVSNDDTTYDNLANAIKFAVYLPFLYSISGYPASQSLKCADGLSDTVEYLDKSRKWYKFLLELYDNALSTYEMQRNISESPCNELAEFVFKNDNQNETESSDVLEPFVKICDPQHEYDFKAITLNKPKSNALYSLMNLTMNYGVDSSCEANKLLIKGQFVKISDIKEYQTKCQTPPKFIQLFAYHKLFIDQDLETTGEVELSALAETWDVYSIRKLVLRGEQGKPLGVLKAADGKGHGQQGEKGMPGLPGNPGGHFFGVGDSFINLPNLMTISIGGEGGPGQHGGDGAQGIDGKDAENDLNMNETYPKKSPGHIVLSYSSTNGTCAESKPCVEIYVLQGQEGESGGNGGDGGVGGKGGSPGTINFIPTSNSGGKQFRSELLYGSRGPHGYGGVGGKGGTSGKNGRVLIRNPTKLGDTTLPPEFTLLSNSITEGFKGLNNYWGSNSDGIQDPQDSKPLTNHANIVDEFKAYLRENMDRILSGPQLKQFYDVLERTNIPTELTSTSTTTTTTEITTTTNRTVVEPTKNTTISAANNLNSPINIAMNLVTDLFLPLRSLYSTLATNFKSIEKDSTLSQLNAYSTSTTTKIDDFNVNGIIALADFLMRCITKEKPYNNMEKNIDISEVRATTLSIITEFDTVLSHLTDEFNIPHQTLEFNPVSLISKLDKKLSNWDSRGLTKILFQSIKDNAVLNYENFENCMQPRIDQVLKRQKPR